ncbi:MAG TPA: hypothetical protein PKY63_08250 [Bacteroidales bacterium]|nr:hypothetical protein [Bacteroidales bacterium]
MSTKSKTKRNFAVVFLFIVVVMTSCSTDNTGKLLQNTGSILASVQRPPDTTLNIPWLDGDRKVYVIPANTFFSRGNILLLHGWNLPPLGWCEQTTLCKKLRDAGFNIIIPDMGKSMYASQTYDETLPTMAEQPLRSWLTDTVIFHLRDSFKLFTQEANNFIVGLSTGARGAFAVGIDIPEVFDGAVVLSGDYDQTLMSDDNLMTYFYGSYEEYPERWKGEDNMLLNADKWTLPIYIGHAQQDRVVPWLQSDTLNKTLLKIGKVEPVTHFPKNFGHDYTYWESESDNIIAFIRKICDREITSEK